MTTVLHTILSDVNAHPRDANIKFYEKDHKYVILTEPGIGFCTDMLG